MELFETALFYFFAAILVVSALCVVTAKNPVRAVLFLVLCFFNAAVLWIFLQAEFLAMILVLVYVGAVMVLFLFIVMMMDIDMTSLKGIAKQNLAAAGVVGILMVAELGLVLFRGFCVPVLFSVELLFPQPVAAKTKQKQRVKICKKFLLIFNG